MSKPNKADFNLSAFLSQQGVQVDHETGDHILCRCFNPAHEDKTPSMGINKYWPHLYQCFGCGTRGNAYTMHRMLTGESFGENYIEKPAFFSHTPKPKPKIQRGIFSVEGEQRNPEDNPDVMNWLIHERGCSKEFIQAMGITWSDRITFNRTVDKEKNKGTTFYKRVLVPIYENKKLVNVEGRDYTGKSKIKVLYPKLSKSDTLFNLDNVDLSKPVILVEGIFDMPKVWQVDQNCIALLGATLGQNQIQQLKTIPKLVIMPDNDEAGQGLLEKLDEILNHDFDVALLPESIKDPGDASISGIQGALQGKKNIVDLMADKYLERGLEW